MLLSWVLFFYILILIDIKLINIPIINIHIIYTKLYILYNNHVLLGSYLPDAPRLSVSGITVTASSGETIVLSCAVDANPVISDLYWTRANSGVAIDTINNPQKYSGGSTGSPSLIIFGADSSDTGQYTCVAVNSVGTSTSDVVLVSVTGRGSGNV